MPATAADSVPAIEEFLNEEHVDDDGLNGENLYDDGDDDDYDGYERDGTILRVGMMLMMMMMKMMMMVMMVIMMILMMTTKTSTPVLHLTDMFEK